MVADKIYMINGKPFRDVTTLTVSGPIYSMQEAMTLTHGDVIATSQPKPKKLKENA